MRVIRTVLLAASVLALSTPALQWARAGARPAPVAEHLEALSVGAAREFRLAIVHPLFAPKITASDHGLKAMKSLERDALGVTTRRTRVELTTFQDLSGLLLPGEIVHGPREDLASEEYVTTAGKGAVEFRVRTVSDTLPGTASPEEPRLTGAILPATLRWHAIHGADRDLAKLVGEWTKTAEVETPRRSVADLPTSKVLAKRVEEYVKALTPTSKPPSGTELVGYAFLVDGDVAAIESFGAADLAAAWWPKTVESFAVECAVLEAQADLLDQEMPAPADPDRRLKLVKERLLSLYSPKPKKSRLDGVGEEWLLAAADEASAQALVIDDHVVHLLLLVRPDRRHAPDPDEGMDPGEIGRKLRPTEAERRWLDRRNQRNPPPPPPPGGGGGGD